MERAKQIIFINKQKGKPCLLYGGHKYNFGHRNRSGSSMWRCVNRGQCNASLTLKSEKDFILRSSSLHVGKKSQSQNERDIVIDACKKEVCTKMTPVKKVFEKHISNFYARKETNHPTTMPPLPPPTTRTRTPKCHRMKKKTKHFIEQDIDFWNKTIPSFHI